MLAEVGQSFIDNAARNDEAISDYLDQMSRLAGHEWSGRTSDAAESAIKSWGAKATEVEVDRLRRAGEFLKVAAAAYLAASAKAQRRWRLI